jgi:hypothetical protein
MKGGSKMGKNKKIIALINFQESTEKMVDYAICISQRISAETHFINIVDFYKDDPLLDNLYVERCEKRLLASAQSRMEDLLAKLSKTDHKCTGEVVSGSQIETVAGLTMANRSDLILMSLDEM